MSKRHYLKDYENEKNEYAAAKNVYSKLNAKNEEGKADADEINEIGKLHALLPKLHKAKKTMRAAAKEQYWDPIIKKRTALERGLSRTRAENTEDLVKMMDPEKDWGLILNNGFS